jgi:GT2 family glycosyltransferase
MLFGAAILAKRTMIKEVGGLDERFHMYGEDDEWCLRIRRAGWLLMFEPDASVVHHGGQCSRLRWDSSEKVRVKLTSSLEFQRRSLSRGQLIANLLAGCAVMTSQRLWRKLRRLPTQDVTVTRGMYWCELKRSATGREDGNE